MEYLSSSLAITPLAWLILGHLAGDFLFQNSWMAYNKSHNFVALFTHSIVYTALVAIASLFFGGLHLLAYVLIFGVHLLVDQRNLLNWWIKNISRSEEEWLLIVADQVFHLFTLVAALYLTIWLT